MKRLLWVVVILFIACAPCAYADSFPILNANITYVTASMAPNDGSGDNVYAITLIGPGTIIRGYGGMACFAWCSGPITDLNSVSLSQVFVAAFISATVRGTVFDDVGLSNLFTASGDLYPSASGSGGSGGTLIVLNLTLPCCGGWNLTFDPVPPYGDFPGGYQFVHGEFSTGTPPAPVPEPATLGLMGTGLAGVVGAIRRKRLIHRRNTN